MNHLEKWEGSTSTHLSRCTTTHRINDFATYSVLYISRPLRRILCFNAQMDPSVRKTHVTYIDELKTQWNDTQREIWTQFDSILSIQVTVKMIQIYTQTHYIIPISSSRRKGTPYNTNYYCRATYLVLREYEPEREAFYFAATIFAWTWSSHLLPRRQQ